MLRLLIYGKEQFGVLLCCDWMGGGVSQALLPELGEVKSNWMVGTTELTNLRK